MSENASNRRRAFADVVSVDAWHESFGKKQRVDFHADIVFGVARVGGEAESPVRFRLSVKRAEVVLIIPEFEPVKVDPGSVSRDSPQRKGQLIETLERSTKAGAKGRLSSSVSLHSTSAGVSAEADASTHISSSETIKLTSPIQFMITTQSKTAEGHYRWAVEPNVDKVLQGRPWDSKTPRAKLVDQRENRAKGVAPTVRIEVRCRREDLVIEELQLKDDGLWQEVTRRVGFNNRMAAAISYIRDRLREEGLEVNNIEELFGQLTLGSALAEST